MTTSIARLDCDEQTARRLATMLGEVSEDTAIAAFEREDGHWAFEITFEVAPDQRAAGDDRRTSRAGSRSRFAIRHDRTARLGRREPRRAARCAPAASRARRAPSRRAARNTIGIEIEAALAFGTGHHGTTRGCLLAIDRLAKRRSFGRVLDVGTGTGVLAIAAARRFRRQVQASDIDPVAVKVARDNAGHNRAGAFVDIRGRRRAACIALARPFDLIMANILLGPLKRMAGPLARRLAPGGTSSCPACCPIRPMPR